MGKKQVRSSTNSSTTSRNSSSQGSKGKIGQGSSAILALMEEAQSLLRKLETSAASLTPEDMESTTKRLLDRYKQISIKNKVDSKREELLQTEINEYQMRNNQTHEEIRDLREEFQNKEAKIDKLDKLSKHLSSRLRSVESKATDDVKEEKESRLKMSYEFSSTIKDISQKLDQLGKKREVIVTENSRLKQVLRDCLEEFDRDQEQQQRLQEQEEREKASAGIDNNAEAKDDIAEPKISNSTASIKGEAGGDGEVSSKVVEEKLQSEWREMSMEDDVSRILMLRLKEESLKAHTIKFMEIFDSFQVRLTKSNHLFQVKQSAVEDMTKRIRYLEKNNQHLAGRISECSLSTKTMLDSTEKLHVEKTKLEKMVEKHRTLIEKFQGDIIAMESSMGK